jgi:hypothetical protein
LDFSSVLYNAPRATTAWRMAVAEWHSCKTLRVQKPESKKPESSFAVCSRNRWKYWASRSLNGRFMEGWKSIVIGFGVLGVMGGVGRRWYLTTRLGGSWIGSRLGGGALDVPATMGFGAILMASESLALLGGGG